MAPDRQSQRIAADRAVNETNNDNRAYEQNNNFGGVTVNATGFGEIAAAAASGVRTAASNIRMMTATGSASTP